jgi:hypothetical protein
VTVHAGPHGGDTFHQIPVCDGCHRTGDSPHACRRAAGLVRCRCAVTRLCAGWRPADQPPVGLPCVVTPRCRRPADQLVPHRYGWLPACRPCAEQLAHTPAVPSAGHERGAP